MAFRFGTLLSGGNAVTDSVRDIKEGKGRTACPQKVCGRNWRRFGGSVVGSGDCEGTHEAGN
jgi:hypothetical protein